MYSGTHCSRGVCKWENYATAEERQCCGERGKRLVDLLSSQHDDPYAYVAWGIGDVVVIEVHLSEHGSLSDACECGKRP